jgi:hypothetical protein
VTDAQGNFLFNSLVDGFLPNTPYVVALLPQAALAGVQATRAQVGSDRGADSNGVLTGDAVLAPITTGPPGTDDRSVDFGFVQRFGLGDFVFADDNRNGVQDAGEPGLANITIGLFARGAAATASPLATAVTNATGFYLFDSTELPFGLITPQTDYELRMSMTQTPLLRTALATANAAAAGDALDSDAVLVGTNAVIATARSPPFGTVDRSFDFGVVAETRIGNFVWEDVDGDGVQDAGERGIAGVRVRLRTVTGDTIASTVTAADGSYVFTSSNGILPGAMYVLRIDFNEDELRDFAPTLRNTTGDATLNSDGVGNYVLQSSEISFVAPAYGVEDLTLDFGFVEAVEIGDLVWLDGNSNGLKDSLENGIGGVTVQLQDKFGRSLGTTRTDARGEYSFSSLKFPLAPLNEYVILVALAQAPLSGLRPTRALEGASRGIDSDGVLFEALNVASATATAPRAGRADLTFDFGFVLPISVGARVARRQRQRSAGRRRGRHRGRRGAAGQRDHASGRGDDGDVVGRPVLVLVVDDAVQHGLVAGARAAEPDGARRLAPVAGQRGWRRRRGRLGRRASVGERRRVAGGGERRRRVDADVWRQRDV